MMRIEDATLDDVDELESIFKQTYDKAMSKKEFGQKYDSASCKKQVEFFIENEVSFVRKVLINDVISGYSISLIGTQFASEATSQLYEFAAHPHPKLSKSTQAKVLIILIKDLIEIQQENNIDTLTFGVSSIGFNIEKWLGKHGFNEIEKQYIRRRND